MKVVIDINHEGAGSIELNGALSSSYPATHTFREGTLLYLGANPANGYQFSGWSGDLSSNDNPLVISADSYMTIVANFAEVIHSLDVRISGNGTCDPAEGTHSYQADSQVMITASPDNSWEFDRWIGDVIDQDSATTTVIMDSDKEITAHFSPIMHSLTIESSGNGFTTPEASTYSYAKGTEISITASPDNGWEFNGWIGDVVDSRSSTTKVVIDSDKQVTANFSQVTFTGGIIGIIVGTTAAALVTFFITRRRRL